MSEKFQKGDRVRVEFEGVVAYSSTYGTDVTTSAGGMLTVDDPSTLTLIERPVEPLAPGSVVRNPYGDIWVVESKDRVTFHARSGNSIESAGSPTSLAEDVRDFDHLTLIYDGSNK